MNPQHFRMPAEWAQHRGTILTWPHRPAIWGHWYSAALRTFARLASELSRGEEVHINVPNAAWEDRARAEILAVDGVETSLLFHRIDSDDVWARDHGPICVVRRDTAPLDAPTVAFTDWRFNAWGAKFESALDNRITRQLANELRIARIEVDLVMEGGALEVNGAGDLLTTESVLLHTNRNPGRSRQDIEAALRSHLGVDRIHWLQNGIAGDDTDGHIDDLARFVSHDTVVAPRAADASHRDHAVLEANWERLSTFRDARGAPFRLVALPAPEPLLLDTTPLPASYANFYIANRSVIVPTFDLPTSDSRARAVLAEHFPGREIVGIDGRALVTQAGTFHCVTQQLPRR